VEPADAQQIDHFLPRIGLGHVHGLGHMGRAAHGARQCQAVVSGHDLKILFVRKQLMQVFLQAREVRRHGEVVEGVHAPFGIP
jgi:hypothetical protein